ncbi:TetR/AcrR family transcriptional regulator [Streptomyces samsunensis]|uniref:TetR family transcriptional regulator n=3 Tax=Streptomyces TaxID=1883 RepID=A0A515FWT5_STRMQ|nr:MULTISPECIES: ScbR family autoregulator-binding transcription factor [Streptomyces]MYU10763.1 TetR family transcriptional regulator [Streptomyces sp. SID8361]MYX62306.1 TetR family transcriptional regulator [Streptomyces sp. SID8382]AQA15390.1 TetR family transcriptional regulator [Streptomyces autolyticus]AUA09650.1 A-factor receptor protein [Streptomyces sp. M56]MCC4314678.1 TetR/AcrR family transcriptional regulator [Streptomyces malaysiensis]
MQERAEQTRRSLLEAAAFLFDERGYAGTSISDITSRSGHTSGAIYFHYTSKERLALAVVEEHFASWPPLIERYTALDSPPLEQLVRLSFAVARAFRDDIVVRAGARLWAERTLIEAPMPPPFVGWIDAVGQMMEKAGAEGDLAPHVDPLPAARTVVCAFFGLHTVSEALDGRRLVEDRLADLWTLLLPSLQARPGDPAGLLALARADSPPAPE